MITNDDIAKVNARINASLQAERAKTIADIDDRIRILYQNNHNIISQISQHQRAIRDLRRQQEQNRNAIILQETLLQQWK